MNRLPNRIAISAMLFACSAFVAYAEPIGTGVKKDVLNSIETVVAPLDPLAIGTDIALGSISPAGTPEPSEYSRSSQETFTALKSKVLAVVNKGGATGGSE